MVGKGEVGHVQQRPKRHVAGEEREGPRPSGSGVGNFDGKAELSRSRKSIYNLYCRPIVRSRLLYFPLRSDDFLLLSEQEFERSRLLLEA